MIEDYKIKWKRYGGGHMRSERQLNHPVRPRIVELTKEVADKVLEMGSASCIDYPLFKEVEVDYTAIDVTIEFVKHARSLYPEIKIYHGDGFHCPWEDDSFPVVYSKDVVEHLPPGTWMDWIDEMWRLASRRMMIAFFRPPYRGETKYGTNKEGTFYSHKYSSKDLWIKLLSLEDAEVPFIERWMGEYNTALYVVDKT